MDICIYHANCADGFTAAWAVKKKYPDIELVKGVHGNPPPNLAGKNVLLVDFSYSREVILNMLSVAKSVTIYDHHKTAIEALQPIIDHPTFLAVFSLERSGAGITWDMLFGASSRPALVNFVEDRDLWKFEKRFSKEVSAFIFSYAYSQENWDMLNYTLTNELPEAIMEGKAILRKQERDIEELLRLCSRKMTIGGVEMKVANIPYTLASEAANILAQKQGVAACYTDISSGRQFSLRSTRESGIDVSAIAAKYGGGGHMNASGFKVPHTWEGDKTYPIDATHYM